MEVEKRLQNYPKLKEIKTNNNKIVIHDPGLDGSFCYKTHYWDIE